MAGANNPKGWPKLDDSTKSIASTSEDKGAISKDWPSLSDSTTVCNASNKEEQNRLKSDISDTASGVNNSTSTNNNKTGARRKNKKEKWSPLFIHTKSYRDNRNERQNINESDKFHLNGRRNNNNNYESANGSTNSHENFRGRPFRGGRYSRGNSQYRSRRDTTFQSDSSKYLRLPQETESLQPHLEESSNAVESNNYPEEILDKIRCQIEYYFCEFNLLKDRYLRSQMDDQGYVQLSVIAKFRRIAETTDDMQLILTAVKKSSHLEVSEDVKIRPVVDPLRWRLQQTNSTFNEVLQQLYSMNLNAPVYGSVTPNPWQYMRNATAMPCIYDPNIYTQVDLSNVAVENRLDVPPNEHGCATDQQDSKLCSDETSQFVENNSNLNGTAVDSADEKPPYYESNTINDVTDTINILNPPAYTSNPISSHPSGQIPYQFVTSYFTKHTTFGSVNEIQPYTESNSNVPAFDANIPNGQTDQFRYEEGGSNFSFGQSNDVIMYECNSGHYYMAASDDIVANSPDKCEEESSLHNKSPEPPR